MRKFSKILAVLLALCLLCGAIVMSAGATSDEFTIANHANAGKWRNKTLAQVASLVPATDANGVAANTYIAIGFDGSTTGDGLSGRLNIFGLGTGAAPGQNVVGYYGANSYSKNIYYDIVKTISLGETAKNSYYCIQPHAQFAPSFSDNYATTTKAMPWIYLSTMMSSKTTDAEIAADTTNMAKAAYGVVDFDYATDRYKFKNATGEWRVAYPHEITDNGDGTWSWANPTNGGALETVTDLGLAYDTTKWSIRTSAPTGTGSKLTTNEKNHNFWFVDLGNDEWAIYACNAVNGSFANAVDTGARLSNEVLEWNHFTFVIARDAEDLGKSMIYGYLNGECFYKAVANSTASATDSLFMSHYVVDAGLGEFKVWDKSIAIDNLAANYYPIGWNSGDAYGIDDYFNNVAATVAEMAPLYNCSDVIYKNGYTYGYPSAGYASLNNEEAKYTIPGTINDYLQANLKTDDVVNLNGISLKDFVVPEGVDYFEVDVANGATFSLAGGQLYDISKAGDTYTVEAVNYDREIIVKWYDVNGNFISEETYAYSDTINAPVVEMSKTLASTKDKGIISTTFAAGWTYDIDGDDTYYEPTALGTGLIDADLYGALEEQASFEGNDEGPMVLNVKATSTSVEETEVTGFIIYTTDANGNIVVSTMENAWDRSKLLVGTWNAPTDSTLVFYMDASGFHTTKGYIAVSDGKTLTVDVNGHYINCSLAYSSGAQTGLFMVGTGSTLNLKSSVEGAAINYCTYNRTSGSIQSAGMIQFAKMAGTITGDKAVVAAINNSSTVNIDGDNMTFYTGAIVSGATEWCTDLTEETQSVVNIDGGMFNVTHSYQAFTNNDNIVYNVANAKFNLGANSLLSNNGGRYFRAIATFTNCEIFSEGSIFGRANTTNSIAEYTFNGCTIVGFNDPGNDANDKPLFTIAKVTLGAGNKISGTYDKAIIADGVFVPYNNSGLTVGTASITGQKVEGYYYDNSKGWLGWNPTEVTISGNIAFATYANPADCLADGYTKVEWLKPDGSVYVTDYYFPGSTANVPEQNFKAPSGDNWTALDYEWDGAEGDALLVGKEAKTFSPVTTETVGYITGLKANLTLTGQQSFHLYLPKYEGEGFTLVGIDGRNFSGYAVSVGNGYTTLADGKEYIMITTKFAPYDLVAFDATVNFKIGETEYSAVVTFDFFKYADSVFEMPEYACGSEAATLLFNLLQFKRESYIYKFKVVDKRNYDQAVVDNVDKYLNDKHGDKCACMTDITGNVDFSIDLGENGKISVSYDENGKPVYGDGSLYGRGKLDGVMTAVQYSMNSGDPTVVFYIDKGICENVTGVQVRFRRAIVGKNVVVWTDYMTVAARTTDTPVYRYQIAGIPMHMQACMMEVAVTFADGTTKTGNYSLSEYCQATISQNEWSADATTYEQCQKTAKAFYALSKAAFAYKTSPNATIE